MTSEEYRELADLCDPTSKALGNIARAYVLATGAATTGLQDIQTWLDQGAPMALREYAHYLRQSEDAERQLRADIRAMAKAGEGHVDVDAIIRRVREEKS